MGKQLYYIKYNIDYDNDLSKDKAALIIQKYYKKYTAISFISKLIDYCKTEKKKTYYIDDNFKNLINMQLLNLGLSIYQINNLMYN